MTSRDTLHTQVDTLMRDTRRERRLLVYRCRQCRRVVLEVLDTAPPVIVYTTTEPHPNAPGPEDPEAMARDMARSRPHRAGEWDYVRLGDPAQATDDDGRQVIFTVCGCHRRPVSPRRIHTDLADGRRTRTL